MPLRRLKTNFALKVFFSFLGLLAVMFGIMNLVFLQIQKEDLRARLIHHGEQLVAIFAESARLAVFAEDRAKLTSLSQGLLAVEEILAVCTLRGDQQCLVYEQKSAQRHPSMCPSHSANELAPGFLEKVRQSAMPEMLETESSFEFWAPVRSRGPAFNDETLYFGGQSPSGPSPVIGFVGMTIDKQPLAAGLRQIMKKNSAILLSFILVSAVITWFIVRTVTSPLARLISKVKTRDAGPDVKQDELGLLTTTYDSLIAQVNEAFGTISNLNRDLEQKIEQLKKEITAREKAEIELRRHEEQYRTLVETIKDIVYSVDVQGLFTYISPMVERLCGYRPEELIGRRFTDFLLPAEMDKVLGEFAKGLRTASTSSYAAIFITKAGAELAMEISAAPLLNSRGEQVGRLGAARDITARLQAEKQRKELELKAMQQAKLASLGEIATGVAHEINQPLSFIKVIYESTLRDFEQGSVDDQELKTDFREALRQVNRITHIVNHLRTFGRKEPGRFEPVQLTDVLANTMILMGEKIRQKQIDLIKEANGPVPEVYGSTINLEQVFINLLQNSIDALEGTPQGRITVAMTEAGDEVNISVSDNGPGIPPELRDKVFEPFFTTREVGKGTGLGLAIVYGIINDHKGSIRLEPGPEGGSKFVITLPKYQEVATEGGAEEA